MKSFLIKQIITHKCRIKHDFAKQSLLFYIAETINNCTINIKEKLTNHSIEGMSMYANTFYWLIIIYNVIFLIVMYVYMTYKCYIVFILRARGVGPVLVQCWPAVYDVGPTFSQPCVESSYLLGMCINVYGYTLGNW